MGRGGLVRLMNTIDVNTNLTDLVDDPATIVESHWTAVGESGWLHKYIPLTALSVLDIAPEFLKNKSELMWVPKRTLMTMKLNDFPDLDDEQNVSGTFNAVLHLLLQAGYISIHELRARDDEIDRYLASPNKAVYTSLVDSVAYK